MNSYIDLCSKILAEGTECADRTGTGTVSLFGESMRFDLREGFPAVTQKKLAFESVKAELAMFLDGVSSIDYLHAHNCKIWDANYNSPSWNPKEPGDLGRIYGVQWRDWDGHTDQLALLVEGLRRDPNGRRHLVTAWNPSELREMCLPPCHVMFQARRYGNDLDLAVYMRSIDMFLGAPFDIASYALLAHLIAQEVGLSARSLVMFCGDAHIYKDHLRAVGTMLSREPLPPPTLRLLSFASTLNFKPEMAKLDNYLSHPAIPAKMSV